MEAASESQQTRSVSESETETPEIVNHESLSVTKSVAPIFSPEDDAPPPEMPQVQAHAVDAARERLALEAGEEVPSSGTPATCNVNPPVYGATAKAIPGETDADGRAYDPAIHEFPIRYNKAGFIAKKRGGAQKKPQTYNSVAAPVEKEVPQPTQEAAAPAAVSPAAIQANAEMCAGLFLTAAKMLGGEEFEAEKGEKEMLSGAFAGYIATKGIVDIPPGIALLAAMGMFVGARWNKPNFTASREKLVEKAQEWLS